MVGTKRQRDLTDRLSDATRERVDLPDLAQVVYAAVVQHVPFSFGCFAATDPVTGLITWTSKTRNLGVGDEEFAAAEYGPADVNSFTEIAGRQPPVGVLSVDTGGRPEQCRRHREFMRPRFGFTDELRVVFVSRGASWGALALYRGAGEPPFSAADATQLGAASALVAEAIARSLFRLGTLGAEDDEAIKGVADGPAVLIVDADDRVTHLTPSAQAAIDELGGWDHGSLPTNLLAVVATTRSNRTASESRTRGHSGRWLSLRSNVLTGAPRGSDVVVSIEPTPRAALSRLTLAAHGLTAREEDVALLVLGGSSTSAIASTLHLSPHTVQDHLKQVFDKLGVTSRREMLARLVLT